MPRYALAVMTTAGLYETSGDWLLRHRACLVKVGLARGSRDRLSRQRANSALSRRPLDGAGNSVKGQLVAKFLSQQLGLESVRLKTGCMRAKSSTEGPKATAPWAPHAFCKIARPTPKSRSGASAKVSSGASGAKLVGCPYDWTTPRSRR